MKFEQNTIKNYTLRFLLFLSFLSFQPTLSAQDCDCKDYIYLNETSGDGAVHKFEVETDGSLTEVLNNGNIWYPGSGTSELTQPHGLGVDLNGFLYIAEREFGDIRRLTCDGTLFPTSGPTGFEIDDAALNIVIYKNTLYTNRNNNGLNLYDVCTGNSLGSITYNNSPDFREWGLVLKDGIIYATSGFDSNSVNNVYRFDPETTPPGSSINAILTEGTQAPGTALVLGDTFLPRTSIYGIDVDPMGNMYIMEKDRRDENPNVPERSARVLKYSSAGILLAVSDWDTTDDGSTYPGINPSTGLPYTNNDRGYLMQQVLFILTDSYTCPQLLIRMTVHH